MLSKIIRLAIHYLGNLLRWIKATQLRIAGVRIGRNTMISLGAKIDVRRGRVIIGDNCHITHGCKILSHDFTARRLGKQTDPESGRVVIGDNVFVGVNAVVLPGVTIGEGSIIGAGAVVTRDVPANVIAAGNPARIIRAIEEK